MTAKQLPAIDIKGKPYVTVAERVKYFNETYPDGVIDTQLVSDYDSKLIVVKARVWPDAGQTARSFTGYSQAVIGDGMVNKTAALENAETSAVGRALGFMGIGVVESIASVDEIAKATGSEGNYPDGPPRTQKAIGYLNALKSNINIQLNTIGFDADDKKTFISDLIGKDTIDTIEEAKEIQSEVEAEMKRVEELNSERVG